MRRIVLLAVLAVACDRKEAETSSTKSGEESPKATADKGGADKGAAEGPASVSIPAVKAKEPSSINELSTKVWIAADGIWLGRSAAEAKRIVELDGARLPADASEIIEPLAEALHELPIPKDRFFVGSGPRSEALVLLADKSTNTGTLRRVLTTARVVGFGPIQYALDSSDAIQLPMAAPVGVRKFAEPVLRVELLADGFELNGLPLDRAKFAEQVSRQFEWSDRRCVTLEAADTVDYQQWLETTGWLTELGAGCLTVPSPAVEVDREALAPPPPPPPPLPETEDPSAPEVEVPDPPPPPPPAAHPEAGRVTHWWTQAEKAREVRSAESCARALKMLRSEFEAQGAPEGADYTRLARAEDDCGEAERAQRLRVERTEKFPDDWKAWLLLGMSEFDMLWPDEASGKAFREDIEASERHAIATAALEAFETAASKAPEQRDPHTWAAMAYQQRVLAVTNGEGDPTTAAARVDAMKAWEHRKVLCDLDKLAACSPGGLQLACCPLSPSTEDEYAADLAALAKRGK